MQTLTYPGIHVAIVVERVAISGSGCVVALKIGCRFGHLGLEHNDSPRPDNTKLRKKLHVSVQPYHRSVSHIPKISQ